MSQEKRMRGMHGCEVSVVVLEAYGRTKNGAHITTRRRFVK